MKRTKRDPWAIGLLLAVLVIAGAFIYSHQNLAASLKKEPGGTK